jgi:hypothetical protein
MKNLKILFLATLLCAATPIESFACDKAPIIPLNNNDNENSTRDKSYKINFAKSKGKDHSFNSKRITDYSDGLDQVLKALDGKNETTTDSAANPPK